VLRQAEHALEVPERPLAALDLRDAGVRKIWLALCIRRWPATSVNG
jgi:hypothetical protein